MKIPRGGFIYPKKVDDGLLRRFAPRSNDKDVISPHNNKIMLNSGYDEGAISYNEGIVSLETEDKAIYELWKKEFTKTYKLANDTGTVSTIAFPIPQNAKNYKDFSEMIKITERKILEQNKTFML